MKDLFASIKEWTSDCNPKITIVANKIDLIHKRSVDRTEGLQFAKSIGSSYFEVSAAKDIEAINDIFQRLCISHLSVSHPHLSDDKRKQTVTEKRKGASSPTNAEGRKRIIGSIQEIFRKRPSI